jgi:hypothetical protein
VPLYQSTAAVPFKVVVADCAANIRAVLGAIVTDTEFDTAAATRVGVHRACEGVPLSSVMEAYQVGFRRLWEVVGAESAAQAYPDGHSLPALTAKLLSAQGLFTRAMAVGYRDEQTKRLLADEAQRSVLIDALLYGRTFGQWSLCEVADYLRLPSSGPFVVIAAEVPVVGAEALPGIEPKMRCLDVLSAWRLLADLQVGIAHVRTETQLDNVVALL